MITAIQVGCAFFALVILAIVWKAVKSGNKSDDDHSDKAEMRAFTKITTQDATEGFWI
jgi:hypothetical protein